MYQVSLSKSVVKFLKFHDDIYDRFLEKVDTIKFDPFDNSLDVKKMRWIEDHYRLRIWKYRFIFMIDKWQLIIYFVDADSRWNIY